MTSSLRRLAPLAILILFNLPLPSMLVPGGGLAAQAVRELIFWMLSALLLVYVLVAERRPLSSIGLIAPTGKSLLWGGLAGLLMIAGGALFFIVLLPALGLEEKQDAVQEIAAMPIWFRLLLVLRAPWFEELTYRGFAIERLTELTGRRWLAAAISLAVFTLAHLSFWGWAHLIFVAYAALVLTLLYLWRRDLAACMVAHFLTDLVGLLMA